MNWELIIKTIAVLVILKSIIILLFPQQIMNIAKKMMKSKSSLRKIALIYLVVGLIIYILALRFY